MALRLLQAHVPADQAASAEEALQEAHARAVWTESGGALGTVVAAVVGAGKTGAALDGLYERLANVSGFRVLVLPLDAVLPRPPASLPGHEREAPRSSAAVSREEVYAAVSDGAQLTFELVALSVLAAVVAAVGLTQNNVAAIIGAMVVAPLLGPNMALALGLTLGDGSLIRDALRSSVAGFLAAFATALFLGLWLHPDPTLPELASRTTLGLSDMILAFAAGCAGTLAFTTGAPAYLVGVMVAVALLPPTVASGLLLGEGLVREASGAMLLVAANVIAVTLAAMLTFQWKGMEPRRWWRAARAKQGARRGLIVLALLFGALAVAVVLSQRFA